MDDENSDLDDYFLEDPTVEENELLFSFADANNSSESENLEIEDENAEDFLKAPILLEEIVDGNFFSSSRSGRNFPFKPEVLRKNGVGNREHEITVDIAKFRNSGVKSAKKQFHKLSQPLSLRTINAFSVLLSLKNECVPNLSVIDAKIIFALKIILQVSVPTV